MLFGQLNADIFTFFSGSNRLLYEQVLAAVYETYFRADLHFPAQTEDIGSIYTCLGEHTNLWHDEGKLVTIDQLRAPKGRRLRRRGLDLADHQATTEAVQRARHIYARLIQTGWLEESRYGLTTPTQTDGVVVGPTTKCNHDHSADGCVAGRADEPSSR